MSGSPDDPHPGSPSAVKIDQVKPPSGRIVYQDDCPEDWDACWYIPYPMANVGGLPPPPRVVWWNHIEAKHDKGTTFAFADGHSELWRWTDPRTVAFCALIWQQAEAKIGTWPSTPDNRDMRRLIIGPWGKLGFTYP